MAVVTKAAATHPIERDVSLAWLDSYFRTVGCSAYRCGMVDDYCNNSIINGGFSVV